MTKEEHTKVLQALEENEQWHIDHDDHDGYPGSDLQNVNSEAIAIMRKEPPQISDAEIWEIQYKVQWSAGGFTPIKFARAIEAHIKRGTA